MTSKIKLAYEVYHAGKILKAGHVFECASDEVDGLVAMGHTLADEKSKKKSKAKSDEPKKEEG